MEDLSPVFREYQDYLKERSKNSCFKKYFGKPGVPNRYFLYCLFQEDNLNDFLEDSSLLPSSMKCEKCGSEMKIIKKSASKDGRVWFCGKGGRRIDRCTSKKSIREGTFFSGSRLSIPQILVLVYEILHGSSFESAQNEVGIGAFAFASWLHYCTDVLLNFIETDTQKIGGQNKVVEIHESKFGRKMLNKGNFDKGQWVLGGVEHETGSCFVVAIPDRTGETLVKIIEQWIEPGTKIISKCWKAKDRLGEQGYKYLIDQHFLHFKDLKSCTIQSASSEGGIDGNTVWFLFGRICEELGKDPFVKFLEIARGINWADCRALSERIIDEPESE